MTAPYPAPADFPAPGDVAGAAPAAVFSAPANILIAGEYAVTLAGGKGVAVAVAPRGTVTATVGDDDTPARIRTVMGSRVDSGDTALVDHVLSTVRDHVTVPLPEGAVITVDTSSFFETSGTKLGFGSSAVAAVLLTAAALFVSGAEPAAPLVARLATRAHRAANGGRGSGYDVAASTYGGWGLFTGGIDPLWEPLAASSVLRAARLFTRSGNGPVRTSGAVARFDAWCESAGGQSLINEISDTADRLARAENSTQLSEAWEAAAGAGRKIGAAIGVPAEAAFEKPSPAGLLCKASGAGNERFVLADPTGAAHLDAEWRELPVEQDGLRRDA